MCDQRPFWLGRKIQKSPKATAAAPIHPDLPTCKAKANDWGSRRSNQDSLHLLYASQAALQYDVSEPQYKQASLRNSTRSLKERRMEPPGNLNKGFTVCTTCGLPFNASYACTGMHEDGNLLL